MSSTIHQAQDKFFKQCLSDIAVARSFFESNLPAKLLSAINLKTLKLEKNSFIDEDFKSTEADVVYSVESIKGSMTYLYILCEHQSNVDNNIVFRLFRYTIRIMELHRKKFPNTALPIVYPLVVYSGKKIWNVPLDIYSLFGDGVKLAREWLFKSYQVLEIQKIEDQEFKKRHLCGLIEFVLKYGKVKNFKQFLDKLFPWLKKILDETNNIQLIKSVLHYVANGIDIQDHNIFLKKVKEHFTPQLRGEAMTIAQALEQVGIQKGIQKGILQGERIIVLNLLEQKFGKKVANYRSFIEKADSEKLIQLAKLIIDAELIEEVFESA